MLFDFFFFQAEDGIRDLVRSRGLGDVYKRQVEDFTEFEQRAAYFDGDHVMATKKGVNVLERGSQVHFMSEFMAILDFPPAPKLDIYGELDAKATPSETVSYTHLTLP